MKTRTILITLASALTLATAAQAQVNELGWTMDSALKQLDRQGSDMASVLAEVAIEYDGADTGFGPIRSGRIYVNDRGDLRLQSADPAEVTLLLEDRTVHYYNGTQARVDQYSLSKHKTRLEPFLPLGFSMTGRDLERDYLVTFLGEDTIGDRRVLGLELTPQDDDLRAIMSKMQIWVDEASWLPAKQVISYGTGQQTLTVTYSGTARNLSLNPELFRDDWPRGTQKIKMP